MQIKVSKSTALKQLTALRDAIEGLRGLDAKSIEFLKWREDASGAFNHVFGPGTDYGESFSYIDFEPDWRLSPEQERCVYRAGLNESYAMIASLIEQIEVYCDDQGSTQRGTVDEKAVAVDSEQVFIVHGRDQGTLAEVKQVLSQLGLDPVVLQDLPNQGRTIIEKFEDYAKVGFAVIVCTPDDEGKPVAEDTLPRPRVRQNVLLEWGYFLGELGRDRVCALIKEEVEVPSDYSGVLYVDMDAAGAWKLRLADELNQARYDIDANKLLSGQSVVAT